MKAIAALTKAAFENVLYLSDFSEPSEAALPFAAAIARGYGAKVYALHVLIPASYTYTTPDLIAAAIEAQEEVAQFEMKKIDSQLTGLSHEIMVVRSTGVRAPIERAIAEHDIDLIVLGTHGRTGAQKFLLGSVAEEIFRWSPVPVLTIGPGARSGVHNGARFHRVLFGTDFSPEAAAAAPYAISLAQKGHALLVLLHVVRKAVEKGPSEPSSVQISVAEAMHRLYEIPPKDCGLNSPPEVVVEYGEPSKRILEAAVERGADIIVLGVRSDARRLGAATHLGRATAHKVVANARCPVLTIKG
jgi:nucleotide-binding universal stress UspA family protein